MALLDGVKYLVATEFSVWVSWVVEAVEDLDVVVAAVLLVFHLEGEEVEEDVFALRSLDNPVTVLLVVVVGVPVFGVAENLFHRQASR